MPCLSTFRAELEMWKLKCSTLAQKYKLKPGVIGALKIADKEFYPNVYEIIKLIATLPIGAVPCERSFSSMRRLKDWCHSTMTESRLCGLALMYVHKDIEINQENVLRRFDSTGHRRIGHLTV